MFHLMKLELKKFNLLSYVFSVFIANISILGFIIFISFIEKAEGVSLFINYPETFLVIDTFVNRNVYYLCGCSYIRAHNF